MAVDVVARFVTRYDGTILVGAMVKEQKALKPDTVYEIREYLGELTIREVGPSIIPKNNQDTTEGKTFEFCTWGSSIEIIMDSARACLYMCIKEYQEFVKGRKRRRP